MNVDLDDSWEVECWCWRDRLGNNQVRTKIYHFFLYKNTQQFKWELTAFKVPRQSTSEFIKNIYIDYIQNDIGPFSDLPSYKDEDLKVFPKGVYTITNYVGDVKNFPPYMQDGVYRIEIFLSQKKVIQTGFLIFWKVYPEVG